MRIKMSRMGWNNVLIFASMFMILLFNYSHKMMTEGQVSGGTETLVPAHTIIQHIDFNGVKIERLGATWRTVATVDHSDKINASLIIETWTQQPFDLLAEPPLVLDTAKTLLVVVWVAGEPNGWVYEFIIDDVNQTAYIKDHQMQRWFMVNQDPIEHLIPSVILNL